MLDLIIKSLESLSKFLKKHNSSDKKIGTPSKTYSIFILFIIILLLLVNLFSIFLIIVKIIDDFGYLAYEKNEWKIYFNLFYCILISFILIITILDIWKAKEKITTKFFTIVIPSTLSLLEIWRLYSDYSNNFSIFSCIIGFLLIWYPLIYSIQYVFNSLNNSFFNKLKAFFFYYNIWFLFFLSLNVLFATIWIRIWFLNIFSDLINTVFSWWRYIDWFFEWLFYSISLSIVVLTPIYMLNLHFDLINLNKRKLALSVFAFILVFISQYTDNFFHSFYNYQVKKASVIISSRWKNFEAYDDAKWLFLDTAFLNLAKRWEINNDLFEKLYDSTIEEYFGEDISDYTENRNSFATNLSKVWDEADVILSLWEIENRIKTIDNTFTWWKNYYQSWGYVLPYNNWFTWSKHDELKWNYVLPDNTTWSTSLIETTYKFHFTNETNQNQEVVMFFETPSQNSVVTGLRLWLDLELIWQIAPRWAARQVYENSLRKNIDPALIEKIWLNTYSLRVFPIPSNNDSKTQWKQLVEIKVLSPIVGDSIIYSPKISFANLKITKDSSFISKIYNNEDLIKEDILKKDKLDVYLNSNHTIKTSELKIKASDNIMNYCLDYKLKWIVENNFLTIENEKDVKNKTRLFFDNSYSAERNNVSQLYNEIFKWFKNYKWKLNDVDLYSYNFNVTKIAEISDIKFWGYTDIDRIIDYIINNNVENENIVLITDDSNYNKSLDENIWRNLEKLVKNKLSVIKIWKKIKSYKSDFNSILAASNWNIYELNDISELNWIIDSINKKEVILSNKDCKELSPNNNNVKKIQAWFISNLLLSNIKNSSDFYKVAEIQSNIALNLNIVNQFNSLIAIQTVSQQQELDYYKKQEDKYKADYENYWKSINKNIGMGNNRWRIFDMNNSLNMEVPASASVEMDAVAPAQYNETTSVAPSAEVPFDNAPIGYSSSDFSDNTKSSMNFWSSRRLSNSAIEWWLYWWSNDMDYDYWFSWSTKISLFSIWILLIYILEFVWIYAFIKKLFKEEVISEIKI